MAETDDRVVRIEDKLDKVAEHLGAINVTLAAQHVSLADHIRRTQILEDELAPLKKHDSMFLGVLKFIALLAAVGGGIEGVMAVLTYLRH